LKNTETKNQLLDLSTGRDIKMDLNKRLASKFGGSNWPRVEASDEILQTKQLGTECIMNRRLSPTFLISAALRQDIFLYLIRLRIQNADYTSDAFYFQENLSIILLKVRRSRDRASW